MDIRNFSKVGAVMDVPDLTSIQRDSYREFLQLDVPPDRREDVGLQHILGEVFPIVNEAKRIRLDLVNYRLGKPRYMPEQCLQLRLTYGRPFYVRVRLTKEDEVIEEDVYLGEMPIMLGGGEFIINGAERVIVTQLHRSPGCDFSREIVGDRSLHACRIIPQRGSWLEMEVNRRDSLACQLDQSGKIPATLVLRALSPDRATDEAILGIFYQIETVRFTQGTAGSKLRDRVSAGAVTAADGELTLVEAGERITEEAAQQLAQAGRKSLRVLPTGFDPLILNTLAEDRSYDHESAVKELYGKLRPGTPFTYEKARQTIWEKFFDPNRYQLGAVGRFRMNRKFNDEVPVEQQTLRPDDIVNAIRYMMALREGHGHADDIDHLGNRRVRTIGELAADQLRKGFLKMQRTVQDRINLKDPKGFTPRNLINSKTVSAAINFFFGRSELSQIVDQTNPLSQLTNERRLSALGPGGLNRKRAGFDVRDVHISHYGRICPIETPEGTNIGLITSLGLYATVDEFGFLVTPYRVVRDGQPTDEIRLLRADEEEDAYIAPADARLEDHKGTDTVKVRHRGDLIETRARDIQYADVSPQQIVGVSASLIPFLEHSDANRALMGSNMQRQAVPLLRCEPPLVATGAEKPVAANSGMVVVAEAPGTVTFADSTRVVVDSKAYRLRKFRGLNQKTCLNQRPVVRVGQKVKTGDVLADGAATKGGELALGRNVMVAFMPWEGYNFEDALLISESLLEDDAYTSFHIEVFEAEIRETKLGKEEFTRDIPNVSDQQLRNLDASGIILEGTWVAPGDILVGKVAPKSRSELTPEEKLLYAIFGKAGEDVKNDSLVVPPGADGVVVETQKFSRRSYLSEQEQEEVNERSDAINAEYGRKIAALFAEATAAMEREIGRSLVDTRSGRAFEVTQTMDWEEVLELEEQFEPGVMEFEGARDSARIARIYEPYADQIEELKAERDGQLVEFISGDELPSGVLEMVKVYIATKRKLSVGDKMAGRHGNKGVIAKILPREDMPFLADGTPVDVVLNPLGVPSRMNVGQILETHLGWAARVLGFQAVTPVFDGASEEEIRACLREAGLPEDGKTVLYDGRTGEPFHQRVTVGHMYIMKLGHLVDDKVHARATGPYSLITQQPLGGKARSGGQRFGEMEVWALEAYGAAHILQELLTVKSDDIEGRTKIYESMVKGENVLEAGVPVAFEVLCNEIKGLCLNIRLEKEGI
ncbi:MAG: DNA-directed RNA polymerase subunit beta [Candidatus Brocadiaceae bacterium]|nr:DNA-directed RNA polymerase subunit beta [Candidatus Brocadiaceae bacterium]